MEKATSIFEKHWTKATGKPLDEATKHHMKYAIEAIEEALLLGDVGLLPEHKCKYCGAITRQPDIECYARNIKP